MSGKDTLKIIDRFVLKHKLGQGTFSYIYEAFDKHLAKDVALKVEKKDKNKTILLFEYNVLLNLKGLKHVAGVYDFVQNSEQNLIVMDLLGINLARARRCLEQSYDLKIAIHILLEMLVAIQEVHDRGFIHRDVKASNFVLCKENRRVFIVDFGLAKKHLNNEMQVMPKRKKADFRGTVSFASLNAHNNIDLARRDDLWSFYFTMLDFLNEKLEWREQRDYTINQVKDIKIKCLKNPSKKLWVGPTQSVKEVEQIFNLIDKLQYQDRPNYSAIENLLLGIYNNYDMIGIPVGSGQQTTVKWQMIQKGCPICPDINRLNQKMKRTRQQDFMDYFNNHKLCQTQRPQQNTPINQQQVPEAAKAAPAPALFQGQIGNQNIQFENGQNLAKVASVMDHINMVNDCFQQRIQNHMPMIHLANVKSQPGVAGNMQESTGNGIVGNQVVMNSSNLAMANMLSAPQNFMQQAGQQRSQMLNQFPMGYLHREQVATPSDDALGLNNNIQGHQNNFFYQNQQMKQGQSLNGGHAGMQNLGDPYNMMAGEGHNNQVQGLLQQNGDAHMLLQQQAQMLQNEGFIQGMPYFPMLETGLQNFAQNNYFAQHLAQANSNQNIQAQEFANAANQAFAQQNTPRNTARQYDMLNKITKNSQINAQNQQIASQQNMMNNQSGNFMQMGQPKNLKMHDFQNPTPEMVQQLTALNLSQLDKNSQLHYLESQNQLLRQNADQMHQKMRMQQYMNAQEIEDYEAAILAQRNQMMQKQAYNNQIKELQQTQIKSVQKSVVAAQQQLQNKQQELQKNSIQKLSGQTTVNAYEKNARMFANTTATGNVNLRQTQKQLQLMQQAADAKLQPQIAAIQNDSKNQIEDDQQDEGDQARKRDAKKQAKVENQPEVQLNAGDNAQLKRRNEGQPESKDNRQMINQHIFYAPQIIFMAGNQQQGENQSNLEKYQQDQLPEKKFYYYDPQRYEKSSKPIFKIEKLVFNRPGYQQLLNEKFIRLKEEQMRQNQPGEVLPGQDQDQMYQPEMLPFAEMIEPNLTGGQLEFQLDTDKPDLMNYLPGGSLGE